MISIVNRVSGVAETPVTDTVLMRWTLGQKEFDPPAREGKSAAPHEQRFFIIG